MSRLSDAVRAARALVSDPDTAARVVRLLTPTHGATVRSPADAADVVRPYLAGRETEALVAVGLDRRNRVVDVAILTTGNDAFCIVDAAQVYRWALTRVRPVASILLAHNHPSGDPTPSSQDRDVTDRVARAGRMLGVPLVDHIVVTDTGHRSLAEDGCLPPWARSPGDVLAR